MNTKQFSRALTLLGMTQQGFAKAIDVNERTVRDWAGGRSRVPGPVAALLNLMLDTKSTTEDLRT
jgi:DNA-binding transcriptional regulator YiaG